ncbi:MAG: hypothetical protein ACR650_09700 [Methylocystis sp.]
MDNRDFCAATGKVAYPTRKRARLAAEAVSRKGGGQAAHPFECAHCGEWHIGRPAGRRASDFWRRRQRHAQIAQGGHHV